MLPLFDERKPMCHRCIESGAHRRTESGAHRSIESGPSATAISETTSHSGNVARRRSALLFVTSSTVAFCLYVFARLHIVVVIVTPDKTTLR